MTPRFSVCLATRDRRDWLPGALESVMAQTFTDWELIVLDNGRDDHVRDLMPRDPRVMYLADMTVDGMCEAYNAAFRRARGELMVSLADDDRLPAGALDLYHRNIGHAAWIVGGCHIVDMDGKVLHYRGGTRANVEATRRGDMMMGGAVCWHRTLYSSVGGFDKTYEGAPDFELYCRMLDYADPAVIPDVCHIYIDHPDTQSRRMADRQHKAVTAVQRRCAEAAK